MGQLYRIGPMIKGKMRRRPLGGAIYYMTFMLLATAVLLNKLCEWPFEANKRPCNGKRSTSDEGMST